MRILFIITQSEMGGAQRFLYNFVSRIKDRHEILVATGSDGGQELITKLSELGIKTVTFSSLKRDIDPINDFKAYSEIRRLLEKYRPDDLFLLSSKAGFIGSFASVFPSRINQLKVIYRIGGWTFNDPWPAWKKQLLTNMEKLSSGWKDIIIVNNLHDFKQAEQLKIKPRKNTALVHNGVDIYKLDFLPKDEARAELFKKLPRQANKIIGTVANHYPPKGLKTLIETAEYFKNDETIFVVLGDGQERPELEGMINEKGLSQKIFLLGRMPDAYRVMMAFDIFVLPSLKEGFPFSVLEAMAGRIPVIATRVGAVPEIIENGKNGFIVEPGNPPALAGKIKELLANERLCQEFAIQGHQTVLFKFTEEKMVQETEKIL